MVIKPVAPMDFFITLGTELRVTENGVSGDNWIEWYSQTGNNKKRKEWETKNQLESFTLEKFLNSSYHCLRDIR